MKKNYTFFFSLLFLIFIGGKLNAAILLVNNTATLYGQFTTIDDAIAAASPFDTIYVSGTSLAYANCTITKSLTLIGAGTYAQKQNAYPTEISIIYINSNVSDVVIEGFNVDQISLFGKTNIHNVIIKYNQVNTQLYLRNLSNSSNFLISSNVFETGQIDLAVSTNLSNFTIENNFIRGDITGMNVTNGLVSHNVFFNNANAFTTSATNVMITDNIFYNSNPVNNTVNCTYLNNISFTTGAPYATMGAGNYDNTDPQFINVGAGAYSTAFNFDVVAGSPANNNATDGTDIGVYGGTANLTPTGEVYNMPVIRQMIIQNTNVPLNGNVNVKVRSTKPREQ